MGVFNICDAGELQSERKKDGEYKSSLRFTSKLARALSPHPFCVLYVHTMQGEYAYVHFSVLDVRFTENFGAVLLKEQIIFTREFASCYVLFHFCTLFARIGMK